jgi:hypothetical protein
MSPFDLELIDKVYLPVMTRGRLHLTVDEELSQASNKVLFSVNALCTAIAHGCSIDAIKAYAQHYRGDNAQFKKMMLNATPVLYFAIGRNDAGAVNLLIDYGVDPNGSKSDTKFIPPIAFAVVHGHTHSLDTTEIVKILLGAGVGPETIPKDMWENYLDKPSLTWPPKNGKKYRVLKWCSLEIRAHIAEGLNLSQRYALYRSSLCRPFSEREVQSAEEYGYTGLLRLPHRIIGQIPTIEPLQRHITNQIAENTDNPEPSILVFAGPPGHGKTELAQQLGSLLSVKQETIPCSQMRDDNELLGPKQPYSGHEKGSKLNNHLALNSGLCSVVFLDEFDKTTPKVCASLLTLMSEGLSTTSLFYSCSADLSYRYIRRSANEPRG